MRRGASRRTRLREGAREKERRDIQEYPGERASGEETPRKHDDDDEKERERGRQRARERGERGEKRRHDDRAINNTGEKGDRLQHSAQMLNRYQFNSDQCAQPWAYNGAAGLADGLAVGRVRSLDAASP